MIIGKPFQRLEWMNCVGFSPSGAMVELFSTRYREEIAAFMLYLRNAKHSGGFPHGSLFYVFGSSIEMDEKNIRSEETLDAIFKRGEIVK